MSTKTQHYDLPIPDDTPEAAQSGYAALLAVRNALIAIDGLIHGQAGAIAGKAANDKTWQMADIDGLAQALAGKMAAGKTFALGELTDTAGIADALAGYVLARMPDGKWSPASAQSVIGPHGHLVSEIQGLADALADRPLASAVAAALASRLPRDGSAAMTGDLDLDGNKLLNVDWSNAVGIMAGTLAAGDDPRLIDDPLSFAAQSLTSPQQAQVAANLGQLPPWTIIGPVATTSGSAIDFTSLPAGISEIEIITYGVSVTGADSLLVQLGVGGTPVTTGYIASAGVAGAVQGLQSTAGFIDRLSINDAALTGVMRILRFDGNKWISSGVSDNGPYNMVNAHAGRITLGGEVDNIRIRPTGTNNFDAGELIVRYR